MSLIATAIFPAFIIILLGFVAEKRLLLGKNSHKVLTNYVYYFALPAILFISMASGPVSTSLNVAFILSFGISAIILYVFSFYISRFFSSSGIRNASILSLAVSSSNTAYMGAPILLSLFGNKAILPVALSTIILVFIMTISIFILELTGKHANRKKAFYSSLLIIVRNPLVISPLLGILFALFKINLPSFISSFCHQLGMTAGPCALFAIGQTLVGIKVFGNKAEFLYVGFLKLIVQPALMLLLIFIFHLSGFWAASAFILSALPTAAVIFIVAHKYQVCEQESSALIFATTLFSIITLTGAIMIAFHIWPTVFIK